MSGHRYWINASAGNASASSSEASLIQNAIGSDDHNGPPSTSAPTSSTLANASKRILSSKLILKKKSTSKLKEYTAAELEDMCTVSSLETPVATMISKGIEVEVDLASLIYLLTPRFSLHLLSTIKQN